MRDLVREHHQCHPDHALEQARGGREDHSPFTVAWKYTKVSSTSATFGPNASRWFITWSKPTLKMSPTRITSTMISTGRMPGRVTCQNRRHGPAPSIADASYSDSSTWNSAAVKMMVAQPASFQISSAIISGLNSVGLPKMLTMCEPPVDSRPLSRPVGPMISWNSATATTQDRKCGRNTMLVTVLRSHPCIRLCISRAIISGTGTKKSSCSPASSTVLSMACQNVGSEKSVPKFDSPTQLLCESPRKGM